MPINKLRHKKGDGLMLVCKHHSGVKCEKELEMSTCIRVVEYVHA
jgi:hypothetical protein